MAHKDTETKISPDSIQRGHETRDANVKAVIFSGLGLSIGLLILGLLLSWASYVVFKEYTPSPGSPANTFVAPDSSALPPLPRLQPDPHVALIPFLKQQDSILMSYGWVNKDSGIARIPIERAMQLIVERGLPVQTQ